MSWRTRPRSRWRTLPVLLGLAFLISACAPDAPLDTLDPAGPAAQTIDGLFWPVFWIATAIFILVQGLILAAVLFFREKEGKRLPRQIHGNTALEILWTVIPALILTWVAVATVQTIFELRAEAEEGMEITVVANQWWWELHYPDQGVVTANELHIPVDTPIRVRLESEDVIHSFWVPRLAGKQDVVPGRTHFLNIEASDPGEYWGQCAEFCGLSHSLMRFRVIAQTEEDFAAWVEDQAEPAAEEPEDELARLGQEAFQAGQCAACHTIRGVNEPENPVGPDLTHFASRGTLAGAILDNTPENVAKWLRNPPEVKPGSRMPNLDLGPDEIRALVAYLESLE